MNGQQIGSVDSQGRAILLDVCWLSNFRLFKFQCMPWLPLTFAIGRTARCGSLDLRPSALSGCEMCRLSFQGVARAPPIKLNRADPLRASLRSVGWHGKLQKNAISAPSRLRLISQPVRIIMKNNAALTKGIKKVYYSYHHGI